MKISKIMLASLFITAAVLAVLSGVITNVVAARSTSQNTDSAVVQQYQQREEQYKLREEQYQQLVQQANLQLEQANGELKILQDQVTAIKTQSAPVQNTSAVAAPLNAAISAEKAGQIAEDAAGLGQVLAKTPELVSFEGKTAYEAVFEKGSIYVDAQSGEVLFNGTVPQKITANKAVQVAEEYLKNTDFLQVDQITFRNAPLYRVIFKDGTMVYMDLTGQITYIQKASPDVIVVEQAFSNSGSVAPVSAPTYHEPEHEDDR